MTVLWHVPASIGQVSNAFGPTSTEAINCRATTSVKYCKSTNFGVLLYVANLVNCVFSLIFVAANIYVDHTLHRRAAGRRQI